MKFIQAFMDQNMIAILGETVLFANIVTVAMSTRWKNNMFMDMISKCLNFIAMKISHNKNMDDK